MPKQTNRVEKRSEGNSALADLGIEFAPPSGGGTRSHDRVASSTPKSKSFSLNEIMQKAENVPFNQNRKDKTAQRAQRKPVDLSDLRKALDESLEKKSVGEELESRVEEEKYEDKASFPTPPTKNL